MIKRVIVLSGPVSAGKSTLAKALASRYRFEVLATKALLMEVLGPDVDRGALQQAGEDLDRKTGGAWVGDALARYAAKLGENTEVVVDSVRLVAQVDAIRAGFGARVVHVHISAPEDVLETRWKGRSGNVK